MTPRNFAICQFQFEIQGYETERYMFPDHQASLEPIQPPKSADSIENVYTMSNSEWISNIYKLWCVTVSLVCWDHGDLRCHAGLRGPMFESKNLMKTWLWSWCQNGIILNTKYHNFKFCLTSTEAMLASRTVFRRHDQISWPNDLDLGCSETANLS